MNEVIEFLLCPMNQDKKHKMMNEAPQEGDCHGNTRAQGKPGSSTPLVTDRTRCTHTLESATNIYIYFFTAQSLSAEKAHEQEYTHIIRHLVAVQDKRPGRAWNSHEN